MINYIEKGYGLHLAISAAGHALSQVDGAWVSSDDLAVQTIIDGYTLDQCKAEARAKVDAHAKELFDRAVSGISAAEMAGWPILRAEAKLYALTGSEADCPAIAFEAQMRGVTVSALAAKVQANTVKFDALRAAIAGASGKHRDAIAALALFEAVLAYDYTTGWPEF